MKRVKQQRKVRDSMENSMMLHLHKGDLRKGIRGWCEVAMQRLPILIMLLDGAINSLPNTVVHIFGFGRNDSGVLDFDAMFQTNAVFCYSGSFERNMPVVFLEPDLNTVSNFPSVDFGLICRKYHASLM